MPTADTSKEVPRDFSGAVDLSFKLIFGRL